MDSERESKESMLPANLDEDDEVWIINEDFDQIKKKSEEVEKNQN